MENTEETAHIFVITLMEKMEEKFLQNFGGMGYPDVGSQWTAGFFFDKDSAVETVEQNDTDFHEGCYGYAVIEEYQCGMYLVPLSEVWYKFNQESEKYERIEKPEETVNFSGFAF